MIEYCFGCGGNISLDDFQKDIWLCNEKELSLLIDFYGVLSMEHYNFLDDNIVLTYAKAVFEISVSRIASCDIFKGITILKLCHLLVKNNISSTMGDKILIASLEKLKENTIILETDVEWEALYRLRCRILSCNIAKELYVRGIKSESILLWKEISEDVNEFVEIRNVNFDDAKNN